MTTLEIPGSHLAPIPSRPNGIDKIAKFGWGSIPDRPGTFLLVDKSQLFVDRAYQRDLTEGRCREIARDFNWLAFGVVIVMRRNGRYYVVDGQHRVSAAKMRSDVTVLPCLVFDERQLAEEAAAFDDVNSLRKQIGAIDRHRALVCKGDQVAIVTDELIRCAGRIIDKSAGHGSVRCVGMIAQLIRYDEVSLRRIWPVVTEICSGHSFHERILGGAFYIETHLRGGVSLSDEKWRKRLLKLGYEGLLDAAHRASLLYSRGGPKVWAIGIAGALNKGLVSRLPFDSEAVA